MLAGMFYRTFSYSINGAISVLRLVSILSPRYTLFCVGYLMATNKIREWLVPSLEVGMLGGEKSRAMGDYRSAVLRLQENSEPIVALRGVAFERRSILAAYRRLERKTVQTFRQTALDNSFYSGVVGTLSLIHI